jgi:hypothetical protein
MAARRGSRNSRKSKHAGEALRLNETFGAGVLSETKPADERLISHHVRKARRDALRATQDARKRRRAETRVAARLVIPAGFQPFDSMRGRATDGGRELIVIAAAPRWVLAEMVRRVTRRGGRPNPLARIAEIYRR